MNVKKILGVTLLGVALVVGLAAGVALEIAFLREWQEQKDMWDGPPPQKLGWGGDW
jgi:hypothetical protein